MNKKITPSRPFKKNFSSSKEGGRGGFGERSENRSRAPLNRGERGEGFQRGFGERNEGRSRTPFNRSERGEGFQRGFGERSAAANTAERRPFFRQPREGFTENKKEYGDGKTIILDADIAPFFQDSEAVNSFLRPIISHFQKPKRKIFRQF